MSWKTERARVAILTRHRGADDPELIEARHKMRSERFVERVAEIAAEAPPLTDEQIARVAAVLSRATGGRGSNAS
jgi:uncharacterized protein (DUF2267 family)